MPTVQTSLFATVHTEGAILPPDLLQLIAEESKELAGLTPAAYHLLEGERLNEAATRSFNRLLTAWASFKAAFEKLSFDDPATTVTREKWLLPLFAELGYGRLTTVPAVTLEDKTYAISHGWQKTPIHLVGCRVELDDRIPGVAGASKASPHSLLQEFLNRSPDHLWGFVANGYRFRILRDTRSLARQAYVEFDLQQMFEGQNYADFKLLWLVCHQSRVEGDRPEQCLLEKWSQTAIQRGTRMQEKLRDGVKAAIECLGRGFLVYNHSTNIHSANAALRTRLREGTLNRQDYYRQILRLVYRLLFLFVAEDREVLLFPGDTLAPARETYRKYYSTRRLRLLAGSMRGSPHPDLYRALKLVFTKLNRTGCPELALPALGSLLWSDAAAPDLDAADIANRDLLEAIYKLAFTQDDATKSLRPVDYRNLGSEEFGSVYESLLELHPDINADAATFALATAAGNERKTSGSYYTPTSLVNCLLDSALDPVVADAIKGKAWGTNGPAEKALLALKVCDPACGSGHFLIAAAHRLAKCLAAIRTGDEEPAPEATRHALRDVIRHCIYGVDLNPMAVELCRVALWMESLEPGKPLSFLEAHIKVGNSLLGTTPALLARGIPDEAFEPIEGDDKAVCRELKKRNKKEREAINKGQGYMFDVPVRLGNMSQVLANIGLEDEDSVEEVERHRQIYNQTMQSADYINNCFLADAWCAAFVWPKDKSSVAPHAITERTFREIERSPHNYPSVTIEYQETRRLAGRHAFFHWHLEFPDVFKPTKQERLEDTVTGWDGGFDIVLGNPPWERIKLQEKEWFAERLPVIANAANAAQRRELIDQLLTEDPAIYQAFLDDRRKAEGESTLARQSGRFPLCGRGDVNTYTLFAETMREICSSYGRVGVIVPSGIATDDTTKFFFHDLVETKSLVSLYDFENTLGLFPGVHREQRFSLLTCGRCDQAKYAFLMDSTQALTDNNRVFTLTSDEIALLNPNTHTCPIFRTKRDAEITKAIYRRVPVLIREAQSGQSEVNPWGVKFGTMFHMSNDSRLFRSRKQLEAEHFVLKGNEFHRGTELYVPLYEGKLTNQFDHRGCTFADVKPSDLMKGNPRSLVFEEQLDPQFLTMPQYWVPALDVVNAANSTTFILSYHRVANPNNERTSIFTIIPAVGAGDSLFLIETQNLRAICVLCAVGNSFVFDYLTRLKVGSRNFSFFIAQQIAVISPESVATWLKFLEQRVLELTYTAWDLCEFAASLRYDGPPFVWNSDRRFLIRCEIDAAFFHLYSLSRQDADYIMETFTKIRKNDIGKYGTYRTKDMILEMYDAMAEAMHSGAAYSSRLSIPPGPPIDAAGNFIPMVQWTEWPVHIHPPRPQLKGGKQQQADGELMLNIYAALYIAGVPVEVENLRRIVVLMLNNDIRKAYSSSQMRVAENIQNRVGLQNLRNLLRAYQKSGKLLIDGEIDGVAQVRVNPEQAPSPEMLKSIPDLGEKAFTAAKEAIQTLKVLRGQEKLLDDQIEVNNDVPSETLRRK